MSNSRANSPPPSDALAWHSHSLSFVEQQYSAYMHDPQSVPADWRDYFESMADPEDGKAADNEPPFAPRSLFHSVVSGSTEKTPTADFDVAVRQEWLDQLIRSHRARGHMIARLDPLGSPRNEPPELEPEFYGFEDADLDHEFSTTWMGGENKTRTLREIIQWLRNTYCRYIGVQFMHIDSLTVRSWLQERMESTENRTELSRDEQLRILSRLTDAVIFEDFVQKKYVGAKSFSLEGAESLIPLLDLAIEKAGADGISEIVFGMAHRGRLNVLANIMRKSPRDIFREFDDVDPERHLGRGDVKYHLGYSSDWETASGNKVHLTLCFNPSHLEYVNTVALGRMRAKQQRAGDDAGRHSMVILIHGDAAFAGEGVVQETLNLSELPGYRTGGTIHVIVNNQIGFTTPPMQSRSCTYATDIAKMLQIPIFHVNGEDPEAVAQVIKLAIDFRHRFHRDVVVDMYCYRRRGHNEGDEPSFTQPLMYKAISKRPDVREGYLEHLLTLGGVSREDADQIVEDRLQHLDDELARARSDRYSRQPDTSRGVWSGYEGGPAPEPDDTNTAVSFDRLQTLLLAQTQLPKDFHPHPKIDRLLKTRQQMARAERGLDWGAAECLAFATLATEGYRIRLSGQDCCRGTFSHRHAVLHDHDDGHSYMPLAHLASDQAPVEILNSPLSEAGVLGFDYGYSLDCPDGLVIWEAQFGDFANAAQVLIDQFIASAEEKWNRLSGIVLLLPHGLEGQGPEHSSARLERFLSLAVDDNIQIANPTTPGQYFHLLRRQMLRRWRKPLIIMSPKSLLRHPQATTTLSQIAEGSFLPVIGSSQDSNRDVNRILVCSGKIYYELEENRQKLGRDDVEILRIEELSPFPVHELKETLAAFADDVPIVWVQEEPKNMGAWRYIRFNFEENMHRPVRASVCRPPSASPATGSARCHQLEQAALMEAAFSMECLKDNPPSIHQQIKNNG